MEEENRKKNKKTGVREKKTSGSNGSARWR